MFDPIIIQAFGAKFEVLAIVFYAVVALSAILVLASMISVIVAAVRLKQIKKTNKKLEELIQINKQILEAMTKKEEEQQDQPQPTFVRRPPFPPCRW